MKQNMVSFVNKFVEITLSKRFLIKIMGRHGQAHQRADFFYTHWNT